MNKPALRAPSQEDAPAATEARQEVSIGDRRFADVEMGRVLITIQPVRGGLAPKTLLRATDRLRSDSDADVSLAALASDAGLSRFHFCRAFKESTGLSPHAWLRQHRLEQAMEMLRHTDVSIVSVAAALGYASQTAFAAAFKKLTGETPSDWRRRTR
jgi:AraC family transcriptional regulator